MDAFNKLSIAISNPSLSINQKLTYICQTIKQVVKHSHRVSLWAFKDDYSEIVKIGGFDHENKFTYGDVLTRSDYPEYFDYILNHETLNAGNARTHQATSCFNNTYFEQKSIHSLLDFIYHHDFKPTGIICCEAINSEVEWDLECVNKLKRIANISSIFFSKNIHDIEGGKEALLSSTTT